MKIIKINPKINIIKGNILNLSKIEIIKEMKPKKVSEIDEIQKNIDKFLLIMKRYQKISIKTKN